MIRTYNVNTVCKTDSDQPALDKVCTTLGVTRTHIRVLLASNKVPCTVYEQLAIIISSFRCSCIATNSIVEVSVPTRASCAWCRTTWLLRLCHTTIRVSGLPRSVLLAQVWYSICKPYLCVYFVGESGQVLPTGVCLDFIGKSTIS